MTTAFWDDVHQTNQHKYLTGSPPEIIFRLAECPEPQGLEVLDVGVGELQMSAWLKARDNVVHCCDISEVALAKLPSGFLKFTPDELHDCPEVDLAIANLVFLHCDDEHVMQLLHNVPLTNNGIFVFQTTEQISEAHMSEWSNGPIHYSRSPERYIEMIEDAGREVLKVVPGEVYNSAKWGHTPWHYFHVR